MQIYQTVNIQAGDVSVDSHYAGLLDTPSFQFYKIKDEKIINEWLKLKNGETSNKTDLYNSINSKISIPTTGYSSSMSVFGIDYSHFVDRKDGLYLLFVSLTGDGCKTMNGYVIYDGLYDEGKTLAAYVDNADESAPEVKSIAVTSPASGTYKTGEKITLDVTFSEEITGDTVPTLKLKFGTSDERSVTNGTIKGSKITYTYTIADTDKGQLAVTNYAGGTIKDASGNAAKITSKTVSGNTIKANVADDSDGKNPSKDSDEKNPSQTSDDLTATVSYSPSSSTTGTVTATIKANKKVKSVNGWKLSSDGKTLTKTYSANKTEIVKLVDEDGKTKSIEVKVSNIKDSTVANSKLPQTGVTMAVAFSIIAVAGISIITYRKMHHM